MEITSLDRELPKYDVIYVSPHLDDAVLSCGAHIRGRCQEGKRVLVLTVFTKAWETGSTPGSALLPYLDLEGRREEDKAAMKELGVDYHHLDLQEVLIRHGDVKNWFCGTLELARIFVAGLVYSDADLQWQLTILLRKIIAKTSCGWIVGPAAIGFHPDHILVHNACTQAVAGGRKTLWHYYDFPYCSYPGLTQMRRLLLNIRGSLRDVEEELSDEQVAFRQRLVGMYGSQIEPLFGSEEKMAKAVGSLKREHFLEVQRPSSEEDVSPLPLPVPALKHEDSVLGVLQKILVFDVIISLLAFYWVRYGLDWQLFSPKAIKFAYTVIGLSLLRVFCLLKMPSVNLSRWLCVTSICCTAAAFCYEAGVRSASLGMYYTLQVFLGYMEQKFASVFSRWTRSRPQPVTPMKILVVSDYMPPQTHGISTHAHGLVTALRNAKYPVQVHTTTGTPDEDTFLTWSISNPWNPDVKLSLFPSLRLLRMVLFGDADMVHIVFPSLIAWPVLIAACLSGKPTYVSQHCSEALGRVYCATPSKILSEILYHIGLAAYVLWSVIPVALLATINAAPTYGFIRTNPFLWFYSSERVAVVPSSVDSQRFHCEGRDADRAELRERLGLAQSQKVWLLVSRLAPEKDVAELLRALKHHKERTAPEAMPVLVIAGDGPCRSDLEDYVKKEDLPVRFLGFVKHQEVAKLYKASDVCATNSVHETFGLTIIESLACGCPMVMPHCPVFDELYGDTLADWMYKKGDVESLAKALAGAATNDAHEHLIAMRRNNSFNPNLFWSWDEAVVEQVAQYRRCQDNVQNTRRCLRSTLRAVLVVLSLLTMAVVLVVNGP
mmetsp:Transcript_59617/g.129072  ORF Transcript_59617/g.129072 Transcript_59617/m.129072 type:complete len:832 (-) Transcript_59617:405-2900(-)